MPISYSIETSLRQAFPMDTIDFLYKTSSWVKSHDLRVNTQLLNSYKNATSCRSDMLACDSA